jgi:LEA14-like dessication related protein
MSEENQDVDENLHLKEVIEKLKKIDNKARNEKFTLIRNFFIYNPEKTDRDFPIRIRDLATKVYWFVEGIRFHLEVSEAIKKQVAKSEVKESQKKEKKN